MYAKDVMTRAVISVQPGASVLQAVRLMLQKKISGLPVIDNAGRLVGIVTEGDLLRRAETGTQRQRPRWLEFLLGPGRMADEYVRTHAKKVDDIMTPEPATVGEGTGLDDIVKLMERRRIKRLPVVRDGKVVGIVSRANLLHALATLVPEAPPAGKADAAIRERLIADLNNEKWAPVAALDINVRHGVVELWGTITDERERQALIVAAENVSGVKAVRDHVVWVEPMSGMVFIGNDDIAAKAS